MRGPAEEDSTIDVLKDQSRPDQASFVLFVNEENIQIIFPFYFAFFTIFQFMEEGEKREECGEDERKRKWRRRNK